MPIRRRAVRRYRRKPNRRVRRKAAAKGREIASLTECISIASFNSNSLAVNTFQLSQFPRASQVAANYKFYKATHCEWTYTPQFNLYAQNNSLGSSTMPYMYSQMNRTQDSLPASAQNPANTRAFLESAGVAPVLFNRKRVVKYVPNWCSPGLSYAVTNNSNPNQPVIASTASAGLKTQYGWLAAPQTSTNSAVQRNSLLPISPQIGNPPQELAVPVYTNLVQYNGHATFFRQDTQVAQASIGFLTLKVRWAFKVAGNRSYQTLDEENPAYAPPEEAIPDDCCQE